MVLAGARAARVGESESARVFPTGTLPTARAFRRDLEAAKIAARGEDGSVVDLYCLRRTFVTRLASGGVHPRVAQALARHSSVEVTMRHYTDLALLDLAGGVEHATPLAVPLPQPCHDDAAEGGFERSRAAEDATESCEAACPQDDEYEAVGAGCGASEDGGGDGTRTHNLGLKRPLLYR